MRSRRPDFEYADGEREHALLERHMTRGGELKSAAARHHLAGGFNRRIIMLGASRSTIRQITHSPTDAPIGVHKATELAIQLNAFYANLCGALDNLAWAMQYEWDLLPSVDEHSSARTRVGLYHPAFLKALEKQKPELTSALRMHEAWYKDLRALRDPGAHRVPLYAVPGVLSQEEAAECQRLWEIAQEKGDAGDIDGMMQLFHEASLIGSYEPYMSIWTPSGEKLVDAWATVLEDLRKFHAVAAIASVALLPDSG